MMDTNTEIDCIVEVQNGELPKQILWLLRIPETQFLVHVYLRLIYSPRTVSNAFMRWAEACALEVSEISRALGLLWKLGIVDFATLDGPSVTIRVRTGFSKETVEMLTNIAKKNYFVDRKRLEIRTKQGTKITASTGTKWKQICDVPHNSDADSGEISDNLNSGVYHKSDVVFGTDFRPKNEHQKCDVDPLPGSSPLLFDRRIDSSTTNSTTNIDSTINVDSTPVPINSASNGSVSSIPESEPLLNGPTHTGKKRNVRTFRPEEEPVVFEIWQYWRDTLYPTSRAKRPGNTDAARIRQRLEDGFSPEDMRAVIDWAKNDPWMSGKDPKANRRYDLIINLFRSQDKTSQYLLLAETTRPVDALGKDKSMAPSDRPFESHEF